MKETERRPNVTLEALLQLKRAERPSTEFWPEFERTLRAKQLAAIVETYPWWRSWTIRKVLVRVGMPLGATALLAISFGSMQVAGIKTPKAVSQARVAAAPAPQFLTQTATVENSAVRPVPSATVSVSLSQSKSPTKAAECLPVVAVVQTPEISNSSEQTPQQLLAAGTATVKAAGQALAQLAGFMDNTGDSKLGNTRTAVVEPLTQVATPRDNRRTRLLAYSVSFDPHAADSSDAVRSRERITHRLSDDAVYDSITRLGVSGNRVSIKF